MAENRLPTAQELRFIERLAEQASAKIAGDWRNGLLVRPMNDSNLGSLYLFPGGDTSMSRVFGEEVSELEFKDTDRMDVVATLTVDTDNKLLELVIWKADFSALKQFPQ